MEEGAQVIVLTKEQINELDLPTPLKNRILWLNLLEAEKYGGD